MKAHLIPMATRVHPAMKVVQATLAKDQGHPHPVHYHNGVQVATLVHKLQELCDAE